MRFWMVILLIVLWGWKLAQASEPAPQIVTIVGYVDANGDGVNDLFRDANGDGVNDFKRAAAGLGERMGYFIDEDGDGICDGRIVRGRLYNNRFVQTWQGRNRGARMDNKKGRSQSGK